MCWADVRSAGRPAETGERPAVADVRESSRDHALRLLEFPRALELVAHHASSDMGAERLRALRPLSAPQAVEDALGATDDMVGFLVRTPEWAPPPVPDVRPALRSLAIEGSVLDEAAVSDMATLFSSSRRARRETLRAEGSDRLRALTGRLLDRRKDLVNRNA